MTALANTPSPTTMVPSLAWLEEVATEQEVTDYVMGHLIRQRKLSTLNDEPFKCYYRTGEGLSCAAGCLMSEEDYKPEWEEKIWFNLSLKGEVPKAHMSLVMEFQNLHDHQLGSYVKDISESLGRIRNNHGVHISKEVEEQLCQIYGENHDHY